MLKARDTISSITQVLGISLIGRFEGVRWVIDTSSRRLVGTGWLLSSRQAHLKSLTVVVDGLPIAEVLTANLKVRGRDAAANRCCWEVDISVGSVPCRGTVEILANTRRARRTLGVHLIPASDTPAVASASETSVLIAACLDQPESGLELVSDALKVAGWALLDGGPADYVEVFVDDDAPRRARRGLPRLDVGILAAHYTCGFEAIIPLSLEAPVRHCVITVRATGVAGSTWQSDPITITVREVLGTLWPVNRSALLSAPAVNTLAPASRAAPVDRNGSYSGEAWVRVAVFTHSLAIGGGQLYLQELLLILSQQKQMHFIVIAPTDGILRAELEDAGIEVHITRGYSTSAATYGGQAREFQALLQAWQADVVLANTLGVFPCVDAAQCANIPVIWAIHESFELSVFEYLNWGQRGLDPVVKPRMRAALRKADAVVFEAQATLDLYAKETLGMKARLIPYHVGAAAIQQYTESTERHTIRSAMGFAAADVLLLCMGVFEPRKGILPLLAAFAEVVRHMDWARLVLVGAHSSEYNEWVREMIRVLGLGECVLPVEIGPETYPWYRAADFMVSASDVESLPRSMLEAMTFGLPIIATDVFGTSSLVEEGVTGFLCEPNSHTALVSAIFRALRVDSHRRAEMGLQSAARAASLPGGKYAEDYAVLIAQLLSPGAQGATEND